MNEPEKANIDDSSLCVTLTVGQFRALVREEVQAATEQNNGHGEQQPPTLLTVKELAKVLKVKESRVYDFPRKGDNPIPHVRVGRYPRFELSKVLTWLKEKKKH